MSINTSHVTDTQTPSTGNLKIAGDVTYPKTKGSGIKVDTATPTFGWRDITGSIETRGSGTTLPTWTTYRGAISQYQFDLSDECWLVFHLPHDYVPGSDLFIHAHWSLATAGITEDVTWGFDISYAKGHQQAAFNAPVRVTVTQTSSTTQYYHMIAEVQFTNAGGTGGLLDNSIIEVDGLLLVRAEVATNTGGTNPFLHCVDIHYQSTNMATKNKAPDFWS